MTKKTEMDARYWIRDTRRTKDEKGPRLAGTQNRASRIEHRVQGFTMIEVMAVLIILGLLATLVVTKVATKIDQARVTTTKANLKALAAAVNQFKMDTGRYPSEDKGLIDLIEQPSDVITWEPGGYLETTEIPKDGWGNEFIFELYPESGKQFVIRSCGPDGQQGTEDDLLSTDAY